MKRVASLLLCGLAPVLSSQAFNIGWVSFHPGDNTPSAAAATAGFTQAPDVGYTSLLTANGHNVTRIVTADNAGLNASVLNAFDLLVISRSVPSGHYQTDAETAFWHGITAPTMILGGYIARGGTGGGSRLGFMTGETIPDTAGPVGLSVMNPAHPIFAGISLDLNNMMVNPYANIVSFMGTTERGVSVVTGSLAGGGTVLASIGTAGDPALGGMVIGEWQAGAVLPNAGSVPSDTLAGHRLVFLTGSREHSGLTSEGAGIYDLTPDGAQMFLNAVNYMAVPEPSALALLAPGLLLLIWHWRRK
jgi:hypothetical protein